MQWKGPYQVSKLIGINDYKVKVKNKTKVYHANRRKKYFEQDKINDAAVGMSETITGAAAPETT